MCYLEYMMADQAKHDNTAYYLQRAGDLDDDTQALSPKFLPATKMKTMKARSGVRVKFEDEQGNGVQPGCDWTLAAYGGDV